MIKHQLTFSHVPPVFKRHHSVLIALFNAENKLYLARKNAYPENIFRFFGGGVEPNETSQQAATRELLEETGITIIPLHQQTFSYSITELSTNQIFEYSIDLYYAQVGKNPIHPADDVDSTQVFSPVQVKQLLSVYQHLSNSVVTPRPNQSFRWSDWGTIFSEVIDYVLAHWPTN